MLSFNIEKRPNLYELQPLISQKLKMAFDKEFSK